MALSNYLTRGEWNAAYFAGMLRALEAGPGGMLNMSDTLRAGIAEIARSGYEFRGLTVAEDGTAHKREQVVGPDNAAVLAELIDGTFDARARSKEALAFADENLPNMDWQWLKDVIREVEALDAAEAADAEAEKVQAQA
jgi:hypothetical protein